ncbi:uncharacterized protein BJ171DRAFT_423253 [Polychytrium aggregatum]|uniref:uncharacterized protein n=1 Tax=Polychytrium aggregatum TaxID=110093 RepID=UPI0022FE402E|nr:uncharacterized protein BJ171DRAFT_423253 [Polychytrium aggregatum]KAI9205333.1 hypothetical protein BJ171DRAFT_423253 [Polychytrium aggregatum]
MKRLPVEEGQDQASSQPKAAAPKRQKKDQTHTIPITRGRFKNRYLRKHASLLRKIDPPLGLLVSCGVRNETRALGQIRSFLDEYVIKLFPDHKTVPIPVPEELDIDLEIVGEAAEPPRRPHRAKKDDEEGGKQLSKFQVVDTACAGLLFIRFRIDVVPKTFVEALFDHVASLEADAAGELLSKISHCSRLLPIHHVCPSDIKEIVDTIRPLMESELPVKNADDEARPATVCIVAEIRNCPTIPKESLKHEVAALIPTHFKIDLTKPDYVIFISIFKSVCGVSILPSFYDKYRKFNLHMASRALTSANQGAAATKLA